MADTDVSLADVQEAATFLQSLLTEKIPNGDFTQGSPDYDFTIQGFAFIFAYLRKKQATARNLQSLLTLKDLPEGESVADAADAILANLYRTRAGGRFARGFVTLHLSVRTDFLVPRTTRFFRTPAVVFYLDGLADLFAAADQLTPVRGSDGQVFEYTYVMPVVAAAIGDAYNVDAGRFIGVDRFSPFVTFVENTTRIQDGNPLQSTADFIAKSGTALSVRALVNARSNEATLTDRFGDRVSAVLTVGYGDAEMARDVISAPETGMRLHIGGHTDIFVREPIQQVTETGTVGGRYARPDGRCLILRDESGTRNFVTGTGLLRPVVPGDAIFVSGGVPEAPFQYVVRTVRPSELEISVRTPFATATDEAPAPVALTVALGNNYPAFNNKLAAVTTTTLVTSRSIIDSGRVGLLGRPVYKVKKVEITNAGSGFDPYKDPATGTLLFTKRVNGPVVAPPTVGDALPFRVIVRNPLENQSGLAVTQIELGWPGANFDGLTVEVTYDTLGGFADVDLFARGPTERTAVANTLPRGLHPVYLTFNVPYRLAVVADPFRGNLSTPFDETATAGRLADYINDFASPGGLDVTEISTKAKEFAVTAGGIYPFTVDYELYAPDGRVFRYRTTDRINPFVDEGDGVTLLNPTELGLPLLGYGPALRKLLTELGLSLRTVRYFVAAEDISFERRS